MPSGGGLELHLLSKPGAFPQGMLRVFLLWGLGPRPLWISAGPLAGGITLGAREGAEFLEAAFREAGMPSCLATHHRVSASETTPRSKVSA